MLDLRLPLVVSALVPLLTGCVAQAAVDVITAPVRVASSAIDLVTTSQSEADEKRGREMRQREEELGKLQRRYDKQRKDCADGSRSACEDAAETYAAMRDLMQYIPPAPPKAEE